MTEIGNILITYGLDGDGELTAGVSVNGEIPIVVQLGLLRMAEDALLNTTYEDDEIDD